MSGNLRHRGNAKELDEFVPVISENCTDGYHSTWQSPEQFYKHVKSLDKSSAWQQSGWTPGKDWYGTETLEEAIDLAENGWKEGIERVERLRARTIAQNPMRAQPIRYGIAGSTPCVPRAVAGNIFNMRAPDIARSKRRPVITIVSNMSANCGIGEHVISNRAAVVAAMVDQIESAGFSCEVIATATTRGWRHGYKAATSIVVKRSDQYADVGRMSFALGHSSMFRRFVFNDWGTEPSAREGLGHGLGSNLELTHDDDLNFRGIFSLPSPEKNRDLFQDEETSATKGLQFLIDEMKAQNCPAFPAFTPEEKEAYLAKTKKLRRDLDDDFPY